jgi:hypothetical protein
MEQVKKRMPTIMRTVAQYNTVVDQMTQFKARQMKKPDGQKGNYNPHAKAILPEKIDPKSVYALDVDDAIWMDIGLAEEDLNEGDVPPWMGDTEVKLGIKLQLQADRCAEEERRLIWERESAQKWFREEWLAVKTAMKAASDNSNIVNAYHLRKRRTELLEICVMWKTAVLDISIDETYLWDEDFWGPDSDELANTASSLGALVLPKNGSSQALESYNNDHIMDLIHGDETDMENDELVMGFEQIGIFDAYKPNDIGWDNILTNERDEGMVGKKRQRQI